MASNLLAMASPNSVLVPRNAHYESFSMANAWASFGLLVVLVPANTFALPALMLFTLCIARPSWTTEKKHALC